MTDNAHFINSCATIVVKKCTVAKPVLYSYFEVSEQSLDE